MNSLKQFAIVSNHNELVDYKYHDTVNAVCLERKIEGDFKEIVSKLHLKEDITEISVQNLLELELSELGDIARNMIIKDLDFLANSGAQPTLNLIKSYTKDEEFDFISTDVYSFHVDRSPIPTDTFLCTYFGASSDIIPNDQVVKKIEIPEVREKLKCYHLEEEVDFDTFLTENFFDLHYQMLAGAIPTNLGVGNLWKLAVDHPNQVVLPCVHRAPVENEREYRLLLIC